MLEHKIKCLTKIFERYGKNSEEDCKEGSEEDCKESS